MKRFLFICILLASVVTLPAPDVRVTGIGATNYFPRWINGNSVTTNSEVFQANGLVGIGSANPTAKLQIDGTNASKLFSVNTNYLVVTNGLVGIGTATPMAKLQVDGTVASTLFAVNTNTFTVTNGMVGVNTVLPITQFMVSESTTNEPRGIASAQFSTGTNGARIGFRKARGTETSPTTVVTGDNIGHLTGWGYDGANYLNMVGIEYATSGTIAATRVPTEIRFFTATDAAPSVKTLRLTIDKSGNVLASATGTFTVGNAQLLTTGLDSGASMNVGPSGGGVSRTLTFAAGGSAGGVYLFSNAGTVQIGADAATPANVSLESGNGSGTDKNGGNLQIIPGLSTGAGVSGTFSVWTAGQSSTGAGLNTATNRFEISALGVITFPSTVTAAGTTGGKVINKPSGRVNIAAGGTSIIITNSLVSVNSLAFASVGSNDATGTLKNCVPGAGIITVTLTAAATAELAINWYVINP